MVPDTNAKRHAESGCCPGRKAALWISVARRAYAQVHSHPAVKGQRASEARRILRTAKRFDLQSRPCRVMAYQGRRIIIAWTETGPSAPSFGPLR